MATPEAVSEIVSSSERRYYETLDATFDPLEVAQQALLKLREAGISGYIPDTPVANTAQTLEDAESRPLDSVAGRLPAETIETQRVQQAVAFAIAPVIDITSHRPRRQLGSRSARPAKQPQSDDNKEESTLAAAQHELPVESSVTERAATGTGRINVIDGHEGKVYERPIILPKGNISDLMLHRALKTLAMGEASPVAHRTAAFDVIQKGYSPAIFKYILKLSGSRRELAEDITQEVFIKVWRRDEFEYRSPEEFRAWLYIVARNATYNELRRQVYKKAAHEETDMDSFFADTSHDPVERILIKEDIIELTQKLNKMNKRQRTVLIAFSSGQGSYEELARQFNTTVSAVKSVLVRARAALKSPDEVDDE